MLLCLAVPLGCGGTNPGDPPLRTTAGRLLGGGGVPDGGISDGGTSDGGTGAVMNLIDNGDFSAGLTGWTANVHAPGSATIMAINTKFHDAASALRIKNSRVQDFYKVQLYQENRHIEMDRCYLLTYWAIALSPRKISAQVYKGAPDWDSYGLWVEEPLTTSWQQYQHYFIGTDNADDARLGFNFGAETATVWLDDVVLQDVGDGDACP